MKEILLRPTVATDLSRLMGMNHSVDSEAVWKLELRREAGQVFALFRDVRLPRPTNVLYPHDPYSLADEWLRKSMMYTATSGDLPVGYLALVEHNPASVAWITDLVVEPSLRRTGIASSLMSAALDWASGRSLRILMFEMQSKNNPALRLALKFGFEFCGYNDQYYPTRDVALLFSRSLKK